MREIKFRAWSKEYKRIFPVDFRDMEAGMIGVDVGDKDYDHTIEPFSDDCVLMQFTGLRDKSGKEIYEGDIVRMFDRPPSDDAWDLRVEWESGKFILTSLRDMGEYWGDLGDWFDCEWRVAMVGNIFENPELLKEKA